MQHSDQKIPRPNVRDQCRKQQQPGFHPLLQPQIHHSPLRHNKRYPSRPPQFLLPLWLRLWPPSRGAHERKVWAERSFNGLLYGVYCNIGLLRR